MSAIQLTPGQSVFRSQNGREYLLEEEQRGDDEVVQKAADIQDAISEGANSFLFTEYKYLGVFMVRKVPPTARCAILTALLSAPLSRDEDDENVAPVMHRRDDESRLRVEPWIRRVCSLSGDHGGVDLCTAWIRRS